MRCFSALNSALPKPSLRSPPSHHSNAPSATAITPTTSNARVLRDLAAGSSGSAGAAGCGAGAGAAASTAGGRAGGGCGAGATGNRATKVSPQAAAPVAVPDPAAGSRRTRTLLVLAVIAAALGALLWWLGGNREEGFGSSLFAAEKQRTQIGELRFNGESTVPVALDREAFDELAAAADSADPADLRAFRASPRCLSLPAGTRVRVLERRKYDPEARVRILDGPQSSRIVWVPISWVK